MSKQRVYEVAKDLGLDHKILVQAFQATGAADVRNHMSAVLPEQIERAKRHLEKQAAPSTVEERIRPTVVKRRAVRRPDAESSSPAASVAPIEAPSESRRSSPRAAEAPVPAEPAPVVSAPRSSPRAAPSAPRAPAPSAPEAAPEPTKEVVAAPPSAPKAAPPPPPAPEPESPPPPVEETSIRAAAPPEPPPPPAPEPPRAPPPREPEPPRPSTPPKTGVEVWGGRPGVPMPQAPRTAPAPRRVQYDAKAGTTGSGPQRRGPMVSGRPGQRPGRPGGRFGQGLSAQPIKSRGPVIPAQERAAHKKVVRIESTVLLQTLAGRMGIKATEMLMKLMQLGMTGVNINSSLDADTAKIVANDFGWEVEDTAVSR